MRKGSMSVIKPDRAGMWIWEDVYGSCHCVELDGNLCGDVVTVRWKMVDNQNVDMMMELDFFKRWVGPLELRPGDTCQAIDLVTNTLEDVPSMREKMVKAFFQVGATDGEVCLAIEVLSKFGEYEKALERMKEEILGGGTIRL